MSLKSSRLLTFIAFDGVDVDGRIELSRWQRLGAVQGVAGAVGGRPNAPSVALPLLLGLIILALHLLLLGSLHVVDPHQQTVVHELQLGQELKAGNKSMFEDGRKMNSKEKSGGRERGNASNMNQRDYTVGWVDITDA